MSAPRELCDSFTATSWEIVDIVSCTVVSGQIMMTWSNYDDIRCAIMRFAHKVPVDFVRVFFQHSETSHIT